MIGGRGSSNSATTSELVNIDGAKPGPILQWQLSHHCVAKMNTTHAIIMGGKSYPKRSLIVRTPILLDFTEGPNLIGHGRYNHACAHIRHNNGSNYVIVVGGYDVDGNIRDSSEILDVDNMSNGGWSPGINSCSYLIDT